ncbi:MAG: iron ABC transporter substrate-binding protein, partial [Nitrospirae bacterium]
MKRFLLLLLVLVLPSKGLCYERVVVLYAPASGIIKALGAGDKVVGRTRTDETFPKAVNVGSHLRPNIELIKALRPDLIVAGSKRAFPEELEKRLNTKVYRYDPRNIEDLLQCILDLGKLLDRQAKAESLVREFRERLTKLMPLKRPVRVIYEVSQSPLKVAGQRSIVTAIIEKAGGVNQVKVNRKHVIISPEEILKLNPDLYIYQEGPMNRNPIPPRERPYFSALKAKTLKVDEKEFARPGLNVIDAILRLNRLFK